MAIIYTEADTGDEIIMFFSRVGPPLRRYLRLSIFLRDADTKAFIKGLSSITITTTVVGESPGSKSNPVYTDVKVATILTRAEMVFQIPSNVLHPPQELLVANRAVAEERLRFFIRQVELNLEELAKHVIGDYFGEGIFHEAEVTGIEYKMDEAEEAADQFYPDRHWLLVWHHYKHDEKELEGDNGERPAV